MKLKTKIFIYFILSLIPLLTALIILKYRVNSISYMSNLSKSLNIPTSYFIPFVAIVLFLLTIVFSSLLLRAIVKSILPLNERGEEENVG